MLELFYDPSAWASLLTLTVMEVVLGIDNVVFISVLVARLPDAKAKHARQLGLALALVFRIVLLFMLSWLIGLSRPVFEAMGHAFSWRDIILIGGGLFLLLKGTLEIHKEIEGAHGDGSKTAPASFGSVVAQIILIDVVFSVDSIITAIGMAEHLEVMVAAVIIAMGVMYAASGAVADFIKRHPTTKMLALAFLILIGVALIADGLGFHIPRGYIYFAMAFAALVELVNIFARRARRKTAH